MWTSAIIVNNFNTIVKLKKKKTIFIYKIAVFDAELLFKRALL